MAATAVPVLLDMGAGANLPRMGAGGPARGIRMVKCRFDGEWTLSAGRAQLAAREAGTE